ncbi:hypothetical protein GCM10009841_00480 [Microlunatus panaciterrae]|uniref:ABC-2 type transport system permease protein n=1 Tax=Microlunatus panaciterrae TaxID=400768 RepID=A0ABS2RK03_9ACTN|nr:hypothetical protein [Microlunatus panaciterrae]MBM7799331.1 ABC-2 type transport system permease protein [Microlunatus panaciterrae]
MTRPPRRSLGRLVLGGSLVLLSLWLPGCSSAITEARVEQAMVESFSHLLVLQQRQRGTRLAAADLHPTADCARQNRRGSTSGPGDDWVCNVTWRTPRATTGAAAYSLTVRPDGCFAADGDGPADLNGEPTVVAADGEVVVNPLWAFDGCFPLH